MGRKTTEVIPSLWLRGCDCLVILGLTHFHTELFIVRSNFVVSLLGVSEFERSFEGRRGGSVASSSCSGCLPAPLDGVRKVGKTWKDLESHHCELLKMAMVEIAVSERYILGETQFNMLWWYSLFTYLGLASVVRRLLRGRYHDSRTSTTIHKMAAHCHH